MGISLVKGLTCTTWWLKPWYSSHRYIFGNKDFLSCTTTTTAIETCNLFPWSKISVGEREREREREREMNTILHYSHEYKYIMINVWRSFLLYMIQQEQEEDVKNSLTHSLTHFAWETTPTKRTNQPQLVVAKTTTTRLWNCVAHVCHSTTII
jgi:hypothetical protein